MRMSKLKKKILLILLRRHENPLHGLIKYSSVSELALMIYPTQKETRSQRIRRYAETITEWKKKDVEIAKFIEWNVTKQLRKSKKNEWPNWSPTVSIRRALESLRKEGLVMKMPYLKIEDEREYRLFYESRHWAPMLTSEGIDVARKVKEQFFDYLKEWVEFVNPEVPQVGIS